MELIKIADKGELSGVFALRREVFVAEQNVPEELELDEHDADAVHFAALSDGSVIGCARLLVEDGSAHVGRLAVKREYRSRGVGAAICRFIIGYCGERGIAELWLNSQLHAVGFYEKLGFLPVGEVFIEAGIEHVRMELTLKSSAE